MGINELTRVYMQLNICTNKCIVLWCVCVRVCVTAVAYFQMEPLQKQHAAKCINHRSSKVLQLCNSSAFQVGSQPELILLWTQHRLFFFFFFFVHKKLKIFHTKWAQICWMYLHTKPKNSCQIFLSKRCRLFGGPVVRTSMTLCFCRRLVLFSSALKNISSQFRLLCIHGPPHDCSLRICLVVLRGEREKAEAWDCKTDWEVSLCFPAPNSIWNRPAGVCCCLAGSSPLPFFFFFALHTTGWLHVTQITVKSPHAQSFQLLNNTKQTVTYFRSREQAREKTWSGVLHGGGPGEELPGIRRRRGAVTSRRRYWFVLVFRERRRVWPEQKAWYAMWAPESDPAVLGVPDRGL